MVGDRRDDSKLWEKLNNIHSDVIEVKGNVKAVSGKVDEHETILRGPSKMNGLVGDMKGLKATANVLKFASGGFVAILASMWAFVKGHAN